MSTKDTEQILTLPGTSLETKIGSKTILLLESLKQKKISELVGADCFDSLIFKTSLSKPELERVLTNRAVLVHLTTEGSIFLFKSQITEIITSPSQYFFIEWPYSIQKKNLRKAKRYACSIPCVIQDENIEHIGTIMDINSLGCCIKLHVKLADRIRDVETGITATLYIQSEYGDIEKKFQIYNKKEEKGILTLGGAFTDPLENTFALVRSSLVEQIAENIEEEDGI